MSYTYLLEAGEVSSAECFSDIPASVLLRLNLLKGNPFYRGSAMVSFLNSQSGTTLKHLTESLGVEELILLPEVFRAKIYLSLEMETGLMENEAGFGLSFGESLAKFDRATLSWKTPQRLLFEDSCESLERLPNWGMMRDGVCSEVIMPAGLVSGIDCGCWPTPLKDDYKGGTSSSRADGKSRNSELKHFLKARHGLTYPIPEHSEALMGWPIGWSGLKQLGMDKFRQWLTWHGKR
jgi:hypothetical protein